MNLKAASLYYILAFCILILSFMTLLQSCSTYDEGDDKAEIAFNKMTIQERSLYNAVATEWSQRYLQMVREAVYNREVKPEEKSLPFIDIAGVIKTNNDVTLKVVDSWQTDTKNDAIKARWDRVDSQWYKELLSTIGIYTHQPQKLIEIVKDKPESVKSKVIEKTKYESESTTKAEETIELVNIDPNSIIPKEKYRQLFREIRGCEKAISLYESIVSYRLITYEDEKKLIILATKCEALKTLKELKEW